MDLLYLGRFSYLGADSTVVQTLSISVYRHFVLSDIEWITGYGHLCVSGHQTDYRTDCWTKWTNLTLVGLWPGQISFTIVSLYVLLRAFRLTVIIIINC